MDPPFADEQQQIVEAGLKFSINEFPRLAARCDSRDVVPDGTLVKSG